MLMRRCWHGIASENRNYALSEYDDERFLEGADASIGHAHRFRTLIHHIGHYVGMRVPLRPLHL